MKATKIAHVTGFIMLCWLSCIAFAPVTRVHARQSEAAGNLTLPEAVRSALRTHPSIGAALAGEEESTALVGQAGAERYPQLGGDVSLAQFDKPMLVAPLFGFDFTAPPVFDRTLFRGNLSLGYTLFDGGARGARVSGAQARAAISKAGRIETEMMLTAGVTRAFLGVLTAGGVLEAHDRRIESLRAEQRRVEQFLAQGRAARVELLRVEAALAQAEAERIATSAQLDLAERELARFMGVSSGQVRLRLLVPVRFVEGNLSQNWEVLVEQAKASSPQLERARQALDAAEAERKAASATRAPQVGLQGELQGYGSSAGAWTAVWQAGVQLTYPIYTGGARSSTIEAAEAGARKAQEDLRATELDVEEEVDQALTVALEARAMVAAVTKSVQYQTEVARIERLSLDAGAGTQTDYLRAEAELFRARSSLVQAENSASAAWVDLARALGELTIDWLETHLETVP